MSKKKYKQGKQICSMSDFDTSTSKYYIVYFGGKPQTKHRSFLMSWTYRTLLKFIISGQVFEADYILKGDNDK